MDLDESVDSMAEVEASDDLEKSEEGLRTCTVFKGIITVTA